MKKFLTIAAAGALAAVSFGTSAFAQTGSASGGISTEEHQRMMSGGGASGQGQMKADPDVHRRMITMMERCEEMMSKKDKSVAAADANTKRTSAEGEWAWRPDPKQAPGPRAALRPPIRVWVPAENI